MRESPDLHTQVDKIDRSLAVDKLKAAIMATVLALGLTPEPEPAHAVKRIEWTPASKQKNNSRNSDHKLAPVTPSGIFTGKLRKGESLSKLMNGEIATEKVIEDFNDIRKLRREYDDTKKALHRGRLEVIARSISDDERWEKLIKVEEGRSVSENDVRRKMEIEEAYNKIMQLEDAISSFDTYVPPEKYLDLQEYPVQARSYMARVRDLWKEFQANYDDDVKEAVFARSAIAPPKATPAPSAKYRDLG